MSENTEKGTCCSNIGLEGGMGKVESDVKDNENPSRDAWDATNWDLNAQQPHGGQEWSSLGEKFVEDFSVTTNFMGPPWKAVTTAAASLQHIDHYPAANFEPAITDLAGFLASSAVSRENIHSRLILGNGASELIDLVTRISAPRGPFAVGSNVQYKEYERAAVADGREKVGCLQLAAWSPSHEKRDANLLPPSSLISQNSLSRENSKEMANPGWRMLAVINPCNPTGAYMGIEELKAYIYRSVEANLPSLDRTLEDASEISEQHHDDLSCCVLVDESMQLWRGSCWREDSLVSQEAWVRHMYDSFKCSIFVIHSWTKIWSCPGIRLGSILCPTSAHSMKLKKHQVPWSLNLCALAFLSAAVADKEYLQQTWTLNLVWRARTKEVLSEVFPSWRFYGEEWLSWLWIDTKDAKVAAACVKYAKAHGVPIRNGAMGYDKPTFIRLAVRSPDKQDVLFSALRMAKKECGA